MISRASTPSIRLLRTDSPPACCRRWRLRRLPLEQSGAADFRLCNNTSSRVGIALGYKDADGWTTEGWWNVSSRSCETLLRGNLVARFYYIYALDYDRGGEWSGQAFMCSRDKEFTIKGTENCLARGFDRTGYLRGRHRRAAFLDGAADGSQRAAVPARAGHSRHGRPGGRAPDPIARHAHPPRRELPGLPPAPGSKQ